MPFAEFESSDDQALTVVEQSVNYARNITNNAIYDSSIHSPWRFLLESQAYVYNRFLFRLINLDASITQLIFILMGVQGSGARKSNIEFRVNLTDPDSIAAGATLEAGFPLKTTKGIIFKFDTVLVIPPGSSIGYVRATSVQTGYGTNAPPGSTWIPLKPIIGIESITFNNDSKADGGRGGYSEREMLDFLSATVRTRGFGRDVDIERIISDPINGILKGSIISVFSDRDGHIQIYSSGSDGKLLTYMERQTLETEFKKIVPLGIRFDVEPIHFREIEVEIIASIKSGTNTEGLITQIANEALDYLRPNRDWQRTGNLIWMEFARTIMNTGMDYLQTIGIGDYGEVMTGTGMIFNAKAERLKLRVLNITLTNARRQAAIGGVVVDPVVIRRFEYPTL